MEPDGQRLGARGQRARLACQIGQHGLYGDLLGCREALGTVHIAQTASQRPPFGSDWQYTFRSAL